MNISSRRGAAIAAVGAMVAALAALPSGADATTPTPAPTPATRGSQPPAARTVHEIYTSELGVRRPSGVTWDRDGQTLLVSGALPGGGSGSEVVSVAPGDRLRSRQVVRSLTNGASAAYDPRSRRLTTRNAGVADAAGTAYSADGTLHVLDAATSTIVDVAPDGRVDRVPLRGLAHASLRGLAWHPSEHRLYVADTSAHKLYAVDASGTVVRTQDISKADIANLQAMTFAPSADPTDPSATQSLFVADAGTATRLGSIAELNLTPTVAAAANVTGTVRTVQTGVTSTWSPTAPDPAGITYLPGTDRLLVSDSEVDEISGLFTAHPVNFYQATRAGALETTGTTVTNTVTKAWSSEPSGVAYDATNKRLFVSDDDRSVVFEIASAGADGLFGTADDGARTQLSTSAFGSTDAEDVGYDSKRNQLLVMDGVGNELYRINPGPDGQFNGVPAVGGDDIVTHTDLARFGLVNPEGVSYDAVRDTVLVVDNKQGIFELDTNGSVMNSISVPGLFHGAGVVVAPASDGSPARRYYVVDRVQDNNIVSTENDGRMYEVSATMPAIVNRPPAANAGPDQTVDRTTGATLTGSGADTLGPSPITYRWSKASGPGTVTFGNAAAASTRAGFSVAGNYVLRLTVSDSQYTATDDVNIAVFEPGAIRTASVPVDLSQSDAQENIGSTSHKVVISSPDDELGNDGTIDPLTNAVNNVLTGLRFAGLPVPRGSTILSAKIQFQVDEKSAGAASYKISGEATDNAAPYTTKASNITSRQPTTVTVPWAPGDWVTIGDAGAAQLTPELKGILQPVVNRAGWIKGNAAAFMVSGTGRRTARALDGGLGRPTLVLQYRVPGAGVAIVTRLTAGLTRSTVHRGRWVAVRGTVGPAVAGRPIVLQRRVGLHWRNVRRVTASTSYRFRLRPTRVGVYRYRTVAVAYAGRATAVSRTLRLRVIR